MSLLLNSLKLLVQVISIIEELLCPMLVLAFNESTHCMLHTLSWFLSILIAIMYGMSSSIVAH